MLNPPHWQRAGARPDPFVAGEHWRPLQLIIDDFDPEPSPAFALLSSFAARSSTPLNFVSLAGSFGGTISPSLDGCEVAYRFGSGEAYTVGVRSDWWRRSAAEEAAEHGLDVTALERQFLLIGEAARDNSIDGIVIDFDPRLAERWGSLLRRAKVLRIEEAAALSGLLLRACGERMVELEPPGVGIMANEERTYLLGAISALPDYEILWDASARTWQESDDPTFHSLVDAVAARLGRALKARDYLHLRRRAPSLEETWSEVPYFFESVLVCLQGAADAAARMVHCLYGMAGSRRQANWGYERFWTALANSGVPHSEFDRECLCDLDVLVGEPRNSIHGEVLGNKLLQRTTPGRSPQLISFPRHSVVIHAEMARDARPAASRRGGLARWGIHTNPLEGPMFVDPWRYTDAAIATTAAGLSSVIHALLEDKFADYELAEDLEAWLGRPVQWANAAILFGLEQLPTP